MALEGGRFSLILLDLDLVAQRPDVFLSEVRELSDASLVTFGGNGVSLGVLAAAGIRAHLPDDSLVGRVAGDGVDSVVDDSLRYGLFNVEWWPLTMDLAKRQAQWFSQPLELTPTQFQILSILVAARGALIRTQELGRLLWGKIVAGDTERLFAHIRRIRKKIEADASHPCFLLTVRGEGFRLAEKLSPHEKTLEPYRIGA